MQSAIDKKIPVLKNRAKLTILSNSTNVALARLGAAAFAAEADLTLGELDELKVAVSEAVSNSVIHGYGDTEGAAAKNYIELTMSLYDDFLEYIVTDYGRGIEDIEAARRPASSQDPERMGMGFVFMESFMDKVEIKSSPGQGTSVTMAKKFHPRPEH